MGRQCRSQAWKGPWPRSAEHSLPLLFTPVPASVTGAHRGQGLDPRPEPGAEPAAGQLCCRLLGEGVSPAPCRGQGWRRCSAHASGFHCFPFPRPQKALPPGLPQRLATAWHCGRPCLLPGVAGSIWGQPSPDRSGRDCISGSASSLSVFPLQGSWDDAGSLSGPQTRPRAGAEVPPGDKPCGAVGGPGEVMLTS